MTRRGWLSLWFVASVVTGCSWIAGIEDVDLVQPSTEKDGGAGEAGSGSSAGSSGAAGWAGSAGSGGTAGNSGEAGTGGSAGSSGTSGNAGTGGSAGSGGATTSPPSCEGLSLVCGTGGEDCCAATVLPSMTFMMGRSESGTDACPDSNSGCKDDETPEVSVKVSSFRMDKFEVTVARFRKFVEAYPGSKPQEGDGASSVTPGTGWRAIWNSYLPATADELKANLLCPTQTTPTPNWTDTPGAHERAAMNCVNWYEAFAFCVWDGGRLPTEAEWEAAAAGGDANRLFPWGTASPDSDHAVSDMVFKATLPVGSRDQGAGRWGQMDLAGNMWEWVFDWYDENRYGASSSCEDCAIVDDRGGSLTTRSRRGGSWTTHPRFLRAAKRQFAPPTSRFDSYGIRCVRPAP